MTEQRETSSPTPAVPLRTGDPRVDAVLDSMEELSERPLADHVTVFEQAHEELRAALDARPEDPPNDSR